MRLSCYLDHFITYFILSDALQNEADGDDGDSLGVFDGDDYKTLMEMEEFKSQVSQIK